MTVTVSVRMGKKEGAGKKHSKMIRKRRGEMAEGGEGQQDVDECM